MSERRRINLTAVKAMQPGDMIRDAAVTGFRARRQQDAISYFVYYRIDGRQVTHTIGRHGAPWIPDTARNEAVRVLGLVASGQNPHGAKMAKRRAETVAELCDQYLTDAIAGRVLKPRGGAKKASTLAVDKGRIERHIKPLLGRLKVAAVTRRDVQDLLHAVAEGRTSGQHKTGKRGLARVTGGQGAANRAVRLLGGIMTYAIKHGMRADNPCRGVDQFPDKRRERRLTDDEYRRLGEALRRAEVELMMWPAAPAMIRFLMVTGWRRGEALGLKWSCIDLARRTVFLGDTKTGQSMRPLSQAACDVLLALPFERNGLVFKATRGNGDTELSGIKKMFAEIIGLAGLPPDITPHVLRHSFASVAADLGYSDLTIAALLGHKGRSTTSRYAHGADSVLLAAADAVAAKIVGLMCLSQKCHKTVT